MVTWKAYSLCTVYHNNDLVSLTYFMSKLGKAFPFFIIFLGAYSVTYTSPMINYRVTHNTTKPTTTFRSQTLHKSNPPIIFTIYNKLMVKRIALKGKSKPTILLQCQIYKGVQYTIKILYHQTSSSINIRNFYYGITNTQEYPPDLFFLLSRESYTQPTPDKTERVE